jgi:nitrite reductase (NADH) large subunit
LSAVWCLPDAAAGAAPSAPLGPIQRTYGHAPLVVVPNGYCPTCVGCQKNCYDFNPRGAIFADLVDPDQRYASQRRLFIGLLPGLICAYFLQGPSQTYGHELYLAILLGSCCASAGLYAIATSYFPLSPHRVAAVFAAVALAIFYWFAGPIVLDTLAYFLSFAAPEWLIAATRSVGAHWRDGVAGFQSPRGKDVQAGFEQSRRRGA